MTDTLTQSSPLAVSEGATPKIHPNMGDAQLFVETLAGWRESDRGKLSQLKRNVGEPLPGRGVAWFYDLLYQGNTGRRLKFAEQHFFVATIFDLNRFAAEFGPTRTRDMGVSLRRAVRDGGANEDNAGRRLQILIDADFEEGAASGLAFRLRQTVQWLAGRQIGFDAAQLLVDLCSWSHPDRVVQKRWARSFYDVSVPTSFSNSSNPVN